MRQKRIPFRLLEIKRYCHFDFPIIFLSLFHKFYENETLLTYWNHQSLSIFKEVS